MIELVTREKILKTNTVINSVIRSIQNAFFDQEMLELYTQDGEEEIYNGRFDAFETDVKIKQTEKVISINHSDLQTATAVLTAKLTELYNQLGVKKLICLSHLKLDFFGNIENEYKPLRNSYDLLEKITKSKSYSEAFKFDINELDKMIEVLFWTARCDPSIPEFIYLFDKENRSCSSVCKYGNIHISEFGTNEINKSLIERLEMKLIEGQERDQFSNDGQIVGRELRIE